MSDKTCETCRWWADSSRSKDGVCHRFPFGDSHDKYDWCGEWEEAEVTDEYTLVTGFGVPAFKVTEWENGTSVTEPVPDEVGIMTCGWCSHFAESPDGSDWGWCRAYKDWTRVSDAMDEETCDHCRPVKSLQTKDRTHTKRNDDKGELE